MAFRTIARVSRPARELDRAVRDHLVGVHVGLRAGSGLEHDQRELGDELPVDDLLRGADDQVALVARQLARPAVRKRRALLHDTARALLSSTRRRRR
jgi:hypothetical protein